MKFVKFGIFALSLGLFVASCGGDSTTEETTTDSMTTEAPVMEPAPAPVDTMATMPADTMHTDTMAH